jgi:O-antigen/teichoic acid export membrane protein
MNEATTGTEPPARPAEALVARNALILVVGQVAVMPLSLLLNAVMARHLGPQDFGYFYLAGQFASFGFLFADFGLGGPIPAWVSKDRSRSGEFLGSALSWRVSASFIAYGALATICFLFRYGPDFQVVLALVSMASLIGMVMGVLKSVVSGFERTDVSAYASAGQALLTVALVIPVLLLGGRLPAVLVAQAVSAAVITFFVWRALRAMGTTTISVRRDTLRALLAQGSVFLVFDIVQGLQPSVDAAFLGKLAPAEVVGWYAVSRKLVGVFVGPVLALTGALYPTMCRLFATDTAAMHRLLGSALRSVTVLVTPLAIGCALFPDVGIRIFGKGAFGPAADNLRILSVFVFLLYFTMPLGIFLLAAGRQRVWASAQVLCVVVSVILNPLLIPWFQRRTGNGGLGVCIASVTSEVLMIGAGIWLLPPGIFDRKLIRGLVLTLLAGGAMVGAALAMSGLTPFLAAPLSVVAYLVCLWAVGGLNQGQTEMLRSMVADKIKRRKK